MIENKKLTPNFSLYEMTITSNANFQELNRQVSEEQIYMLTKTAILLEVVRDILTVPLVIHSAYRCKALNDSIGSTNRSQHLICQAADFVPIGQDIGVAFRTLWKQVRDGKLFVGQLIFETANRSYGAESWIHISLGFPFRDEARCQQVLKMQDGVYTMFNPPTATV
jgi:hypothetical protein